MRENEKLEQSIATLVKLRIPGLPDMRFQNWSVDQPYFYQDQPWEWLDFDGAAFSARMLDFSTSDVDISLSNQSARNDGLRSLREKLKAFGGWRRGLVDIYHVWPDDPTASTILARYQILSSTIGESIDLTLSGAINVINAAIPSILTSNQITPELPRYPPSQGG